MTLASLAPGARVRRLVPGAAAEIVEVRPVGPDAASVVVRANNRAAHTTCASAALLAAAACA